MKRNSGFTMVELLIVIEIIVIVAALAVPRIMRATMSANEASAVGSLRSIAVGQSSFKTAGFVDQDGDGEGDYGSLAQLGNPDSMGNTPPFVDQYIAAGSKSGYRFSIIVRPGGPDVSPGYFCFAIPEKPGGTGYKIYFLDETNVIRVTTDGTLAGPTSPPLQ